MQGNYVGMVSWFNSAKGFGFIKKCDQTVDWPSEDGKDVFVHYTGIVTSGYKTLKDGQIISFDVEEGGAGRLQAVRVEPQDADRTQQV